VAADISHHPLGESSLRATASTARVLYAKDDDDDESEEDEEEHTPTAKAQMKRPPRISNVKENRRHQPADQFYTPTGAIMALLRVVGIFIYQVYTGEHISIN